jgi:SAM-dependent methyltransferase
MDGALERPGGEGHSGSVPVLLGIRGRPLPAGVLSRLHGLLVPPLRAVNALLRSITAAGHRLQYKVEGFLRPSAEWFDHEIDANWQWRHLGRSSFLERGVLSALAIRPAGQLLELCCGDGFSAGRFYAARAGRVLAVDHDPHAIAHARRHHARPNVQFRLGDIRAGLPEGPFDNVVWDSAIHHFSPAEAAVILADAHRCLRDDGLLSGYTVIEPGDSYAYARMDLDDPNQLAGLLAAEFAHISIVETADGDRRNLYFFASDLRGALPFPEGVRSAAAPARPVREHAGASQSAARD